VRPLARKLRPMMVDLMCWGITYLGFFSCFAWAGYEWWRKGLLILSRCVCPLWLVQEAPCGACSISAGFFGQHLSFWRWCGVLLQGRQVERSVAACGCLAPIDRAGIWLSIYTLSMQPFCQCALREKIYMAVRYCLSYWAYFSFSCHICWCGQIGFSHGRLRGRDYVR